MSLEDPNQDICKIIVCKSIANCPKDDLSVWLPRSCPDLDMDLDDDKHYCLHCQYNDADAMKVLVHCVHKHRDQDICVYNKEEENIMNCLESVNGHSEIISSDSENEIEVQEETNYQPLVKGFDTKLSLQSNPDIPGLEKRFEIRKKPFIKPVETYSPPVVQNVKDEEDSNDNFHNDDYDVGFEPGSLINSYYEPNPEPYPEPLYPGTTPTPIPSNIGNINTGQIFASFEPIPSPSPLASIPVTLSPMSHNNPKPFQLKTNISENNNKKRKKFNLKHNESQSKMSYRQYRENKRREELKRNPLAANSSNASTSQLPPAIDLRQCEKELKQSGLDRNTFKNIKRVGAQTNQPLVSYVTREEDPIEEYINEKSIPKRGLKARFEGQSHFELITPTTIPNKDKNLWKCILCSDENNVFTLRETAIKTHLQAIHKTDSAFKCGFSGCDFIGQKPMITSHSKLIHPNEETKIEKFIVHSTQSHSIGITSGSHLQRTKTTARKSTTNNSSHATKGSKGALTQKIKESTFLGPLKNDRTGRKRSTSQSHEPYQRVHYRGVHSSDIRSKKFRRTESMDQDDDDNYDLRLDVDRSDDDMRSESESEPMNTQIEHIMTKQAVAKKSTSKPGTSSQNESIKLKKADIPTKYFCVFCVDGFIINDQREAIEHYKTHLGLGYVCNICQFSCVAYSSMDGHFKLAHKSNDMDAKDNMPSVINSWIVNFLDNQIKDSDFTQDCVPNTSGINMTCPLCVKAGKICRMKPRSFDALWKVKLHICKHLNWMPVHCILCEDISDIDPKPFPDHPFLLMKHLVDFHFTSCENLYNISFRGQKPYNEMKREQVNLIARNFALDRTSIIINKFFENLMNEMDVIYENQLKAKYNLNKEVQIVLERCIVVKTERIDEELEESKPETKVEVKDEDKKDIKPVVKSEVKPEMKEEVKGEPKEEIEQNEDNQNNNMEQSETNGTEVDDNWFDDLYGVNNNDNPKPKPIHQTGECIVLSSDDDE